MNGARSMLRGLRALQRSVAADGFTHVDLKQGQVRYLQTAAKHRRRLLRAGNQIGKTFVGAYEDVAYALGRHPYDPRPPLMLQWIIGESKSQMVAAMKAAWQLAPRNELVPGQKFHPVDGFGRNNPALMFRNGAVIVYVTDRQGASVLASASVDRVRFDEPVSVSTYAEANERVRNGAGIVCFTLTPVNRDCTFIREMCALKDGHGSYVHDLQVEMTEENLRHSRSGMLSRARDGRVWNAENIARRIEGMLPHHRPVRAHGAWDMAVSGALFAAFKDSGEDKQEGHILLDPPKCDMALYLGMDHGTGRGNQTAALVGVEMVEGGRAVVLGEWAREDLQPIDRDASDVCGLLQLNGISWADLRRAYGDVPATAGHARRSNRDLGDAIAKHLGIGKRYKDLSPMLTETPLKRGKGANPRRMKEYGELWMHRLMVADRFYVMADCRRVRTAIGGYDGHQNSKHKHLIDAVRYALSDHILQRFRGGSQMLIVR